MRGESRERYSKCARGGALYNVKCLIEQLTLSTSLVILRALLTVLARFCPWLPYCIMQTERIIIIIYLRTSTYLSKVIDYDQFDNPKAIDLSLQLQSYNTIFYHYPYVRIEKKVRRYIQGQVHACTGSSFSLFCYLLSDLLYQAWALHRSHPPCESH